MGRSRIGQHYDTYDVSDPLGPAEWWQWTTVARSLESLGPGAVIGRGERKRSLRERRTSSRGQPQKRKRANRFALSKPGNHFVPTSYLVSYALHKSHNTTYGAVGSQKLEYSANSSGVRGGQHRKGPMLSEGDSTGRAAGQGIRSTRKAVHGRSMAVPHVASADWVPQETGDTSPWSTPVLPTPAW